MNQCPAVNTKEIEANKAIFPVIYNHYLRFRTDAKALISMGLLRILVLLSPGDCLRADCNH